MGDGESINATKDPWLHLKADFCVENSHIYSGRDELVSAYIKQDTREWNIPLITEKFVSEDVQAILFVPIPQRRTRDRLVWSHSTTGVYSAKEGYRKFRTLLYGCWENYRQLGTKNSGRYVQLSGIWFWRNKKVWEDKSTTPTIAMDSSLKIVADWRDVRAKNKTNSSVPKSKQGSQRCRWVASGEGILKLNMDASLFSGAPDFTVGMVSRDHKNTFLVGRTSCFRAPVSVFEEEAIGVREALSWVKDMQFNACKVELETDSLLVVQGIKNSVINLLEVGEVLEQCRRYLRELEGISIHFIRNQANRVAHKFSRITCLVNCHHVFTSPPVNLVETLVLDSHY
ncbi:hypothetical protein AgCh_005592 [Apium graveolens]